MPAFALVLLAAFLLALASPFQPLALAQTTTATLIGTVFDSSGAVVPGATVTLKNEASGDLRDTVSNSEGYFTFAAVPPGSYTVTVEKENFSKWEGKSIVLNSADLRNVSGIKLTPGAAKETIVVEASEVQITPVESGEKSTLINQKILQNVALLGQNAAEFIKIIPGVAYAGGTVNTVWNQQNQDERTGNGPVGNGFSANGTRQAALDITSDGAHIIDPGCNCGQAMNTNADMTSELKVMTASYGADEAKGPVVISAIGKSGGQQYHGEGYIYARYYALNANDAQNMDAGLLPNGKPVAPKAEAKYFYPGFSFGGPVVVPGTHINHNRDKLFFWYGMEYYKQDVDNGVYHAVVPTADMQKGIFNDLRSSPVNAAGCPDTDPTHNANNTPKYPLENCYVTDLNGATGLPNGGGVNTDPNGTGGDPHAPGKIFNNGVLDPTQICSGTWVDGKGDTQQQCPIDPVSYANGLILMTKVYPAANLDPSNPGAANGWNYASAATRFANMLQERVRVDYNFNDSTKLYVSYNHQHDNAQESLDTLWTGNASSWASPTTPYPTPIIELTSSHVVSANLTKVINPTLTNELIFAYTYLNLPNHFADRSKVDRGSLGLNYNLIFSHDNPQNLILPTMTGWSDGIANVLNSGFELGGGVVYAKKTLPSVADNLVKVWKTHTSKFGFYWERTWNSQPGNNPVNGALTFATWGGGSTGNVYADMLIGMPEGYQEQNFDVVPEFRFITTDMYATDSWKISKRFTLDYGLRASHLGPWVDTTGYGFAAWYPALYANGQGGFVTTSGTTTNFPGLEWNSVHPSTPLSGSASRLFFYEPRVGFAWDIFGSGRTVLRGGYGMYRYHDEQNVQNPAYSVVRGSFETPGFNDPLGMLGPSLLTGTSLLPSSISALDPNDSEAPRNQNYNFTIAERLPWKSQLEVSYVGSKSDYLSNYNNNFDQINDLGIGAEWNAKVCAPGQNNYPWADAGTSMCGWLPYCDPSLAAGAGGSCAGGGWPWTTGLYSDRVTAARPLTYGTLKIIDHKMYSNYNAAQVTWNKQAGSLIFLTNYTFSKALGIRGENGAATGDPLHLGNNYGTLPNNRTHIFNVAIVYALPKLSSGNKLLTGTVNGWQLSSITQYQSGMDIQASITANFGYVGYIAAGTTFMGKTINDTASGGYNLVATGEDALGSPDLTVMPVLTCNPDKGLAKHQYINGNCFSPWVTPGVQGNYIFPTLTGPGYFDSDLSLFKSFQWGKSESKKLTLRFSGYNFLNHPNRTFVAGDQELLLNFTSVGTNTPTLNHPFGYATNTIGHRIIQGMIKFSF
jgi:hypothetical protein